MIKVMPFTCIKAHLSGEIFAPLQVGDIFWLASASRVLVGSLGNAFEFKNESNAMYWIESNLIKASKQLLTDYTHIQGLIVKNSVAPKDYLTEEIAVLEARNAGDWLPY